MRDNRLEAGDNLDALALLYANGEMDPTDAAAFERVLGEDQRAREALSLAVELSRTLDGLPTPTPNPEYRGQVRQRLRAKTLPVKPRRFRGHPAFWAAAGAAAVFVGGIVTNAFHAPSPVERAQAPTVTAPAAPPASDETARIWSELPKHDHVNRLREEEQRRKSRPEDVRLARGDERPNHFAPEPMPQP